MKKDHEYTEAWRWPREVREWGKERVGGETLHVCAGESPIGDVTVDLDPERDPDVVADMSSLPFEDNSFDTVISDPPWKLNWFKRMTPFFECVRVAKPCGTIIYNVPWRPTSREAELVDQKPRWDKHWGQVPMLYEFKATQHTLESSGAVTVE